MRTLRVCEENSSFRRNTKAVCGPVGVTKAMKSLWERAPSAHVYAISGPWASARAAHFGRDIQAPQLKSARAGKSP